MRVGGADQVVAREGLGKPPQTVLVPVRSTSLMAIAELLHPIGIYRTESIAL